VRDCPQSFEVQLLPGEVSRIVSWAEPIFTDNVGVDRVYKSKVSRFTRTTTTTAYSKIYKHYLLYCQLVVYKTPTAKRSCYFQLIKRTKHEEICHHYNNYDASVRNTSANTHCVLNVWPFCYFLSLRSKYPIKTLFSVLSERLCLENSIKINV
jgi:hypothetical protein